MAIDLTVFRDAFLVEAAEHLDAMEAALLQLEHTPEDQELLNTIFRAAHTIKGGSGTFGMDNVTRVTHTLESLLDRLREGRIGASEPLVELLLASTDVIHGLLAAEKDGSPLPENTEAILAALEAANSQTPTAAAQPRAADSAKSEVLSEATLYTIELIPSRAFFKFGQDPLLLLRELRTLGEIENLVADASRLPDWEELDPEDCFLSWKLQLRTVADAAAVADVFMFLDDQSQLSITPSAVTEPAAQAATAAANDIVAHADRAAAPAVENRPAGADAGGQAAVPRQRRNSQRQAASADNETVRVDRRRLDELINQIGELVIGVSMVEREVVAMSDGNESAAMLQLAKIVRDLQELSLSLRMVPIAATFQKMARVVHDIGKKLNKHIDFVTEGDDTELDKSVVDKIGDPLIHMVRNAADHGIETPEARLASGKPAEGRVLLRAFQQGGNIFIELSDDGRGLNRQAILAKAIERGLVSENDSLSDADICNLIFQPGFSTAKAVTDVSGRGVGMDVVRRNVEELQGSVQVRSVEGQGSTITVRLPLTLAILDGLLVRVRSEVYVIPLLSVVESINVQRREVRHLVGAGDVIMLRGEVIPVVSLQCLLQSGERASDQPQRLLVIVEDQGRRMALVVDELVGQQQVVIKNLEANFRKVPGVAGATILGDGCVALILDIYGVACLHTERSRQLTLDARPLS